MREICLVLIMIFISGCAALNGPSDDGPQFTRQVYDKLPPRYGQQKLYSEGYIKSSSLFDYKPDLSNIDIGPLPVK